VDLLWGVHIVGPIQPQSDLAQPQMQSGMPGGTTGVMTGAVGGPARPCRFRVTHSSGETVCVDLETARALQRQKPGAKIFLERHG
jgi:hypothetical protein